MTLRNEELSFDYLTENSEKFAKDFMNFVVTDVPLFALQDELLYLMHQHQTTSFKIPGYKCIDGKDHTFHFSTGQINNYQKSKVYHYLGMDLTINKKHL